MKLPYKVQDKNFEDWTQAQQYAWELLQDGVEYVEVLVWNENYKDYGLLQELNLKRGVEPNPHFNTWTFAPYFWKTL
jgi:hypothetical protein